MRAERGRQNKSAVSKTAMIAAGAILTEEVGEARRILRMLWRVSCGPAKEGVHVAAVAVQWLECMEGGN